MTKRSTVAVLALPVSLFAACGEDPPAPSEVRERIAEDLGHVLRESEAAGRGGSDALHVGAAFGLIERFGGPTTARLYKRGDRGALTYGAKFATMGLTSATSGDDPLDTDRIVEELTTKVFTDENHVGDGIYTVPASLVCTTEEGLDAECAQEFDKIQLRVRTATDDDDLILGIQVGANHDEPLRFALSHTSLAVTLDLDETGQAVAALAPVFGEAAPNARMSGEITGQVEILGTANARFSVVFNRALDLAFAEQGAALDGPDAFRLTSAAANVAAVEFDAGAGKGSIVFDLGPTTVHIPRSSDDSGSSPADDFDLALDLGGASLVAMLATNQPLQLTHVGLGERTTTLSVNGARAVSIDLNPDDGRAFGATIPHDAATARDTISVSPKLDLNVSVDHAVLGDEPPLFDVTRVLLEGSLRSSGDDQIEVVSGSFSIATNPAQFGFTATAGQCVSETIDAWAVGACL